MTNEQIVKALADKLDVKITIVDDGRGKCCVEEPPKHCQEVYLIQASVYLEVDSKIRAEYRDDGWQIKAGKNGYCYLRFPRSAMAGIRWVEIE